MQVTPKLMTAMAALTIRAVMERMVLFSSRLLVLPDPDGPEACVAVLLVANHLTQVSSQSPHLLTPGKV